MVANGDDLRMFVEFRQGLHEFSGVPLSESFADHHRQWLQDALLSGESKRESRWTEAIAVGSSSYVEGVKASLGVKAAGRKVERQQEHDICILREEPVPYNAVFDVENDDLRLGNCYLWE